jgi:hypothetical protein
MAIDRDRAGADAMAIGEERSRAGVMASGA